MTLPAPGLSASPRTSTISATLQPVTAFLHQAAQHQIAIAGLFGLALSRHQLMPRAPVDRHQAVGALGGFAQHAQDFVGALAELFDQPRFITAFTIRCEPNEALSPMPSAV